MSAHRGVPVVAAIEHGRQFSGRWHIRIAVQAVTNVARIFLVDARECQAGKPFGGVGVKDGRSGGALRAHFANTEEQKHRAGSVFHHPYSRPISLNGANPQ
jgi:hypothetical protein